MCMVCALCRFSAGFVPNVLLIISVFFFFIFHSILCMNSLRNRWHMHAKNNVPKNKNSSSTRSKEVKDTHTHTYIFRFSFIVIYRPFHRYFHSIKTAKQRKEGLSRQTKQRHWAKRKEMKGKKLEKYMRSLLVAQNISSFWKHTRPR